MHVVKVLEGSRYKMTRWLLPSSSKDQMLPATLWLLGLIYIICLSFGIWRMSLVCWCLLRPQSRCHLLPAASVPLLRGHRWRHLRPQQSCCPRRLLGCHGDILHLTPM